MAKPKQDEVAEHNLTAQGYSVYRPRVSLKVMRRGKEVVKQESLFPRCLFIQLSHQTDNWGPIRSTKGVLELVRFGAHPAVIRDEIIETIKAREAVDVQQLQGNAASAPSADLSELCLNQDAEQRVLALMRILSKK